MEKYGRRWRQKTTQSAIAVNFLDQSWLRRVLFNRSSRLARQHAADMVETLALEPARKRRVGGTAADGQWRPPDLVTETVYPDLLYSYSNSLVYVT